MSGKPSITRVVKFIKKGERGGSVIVADTASRHYTYAQWQTYGATGHLETWGSINNADKFRAGDTIVINGVCTDRGNIGVSLYATVSAVNVSNKNVTATTTSLIMGGKDGVSITPKGECKAHFTNYSSINGSKSDYDLFIVDSSSDYRETFEDETRRGFASPSVMEYVNGSDFRWQCQKAEIGDAYINQNDGHLWVAGEEKWRDAGKIKGGDGKGILSVTERYLATSASSGVTISTSGWTTTVQTVTTTKKYLWNYEIITYTDGTSTSTTPVIIGVYGDTGNGISAITEHYLATSASSGVTISTSGWTTTVQTVTATKKYLWNYETIRYTNGTLKNTTPVIIGVYGNTGNGISATTTYYIATVLAEGVKSPRTGARYPSSGWVAGVFQQPTEEKPYVWKYTEYSYTNGTKTYTDAELVVTFQSGVNVNLLDDTDFKDEEHMGAWTVRNTLIVKPNVTITGDYSGGILLAKNGYGVQGHNIFRGGTNQTLQQIDYKEILSQPVSKKLSSGQWHTLSFWARSVAEWIGVSMTSGEYGFGAKSVYLEAGIKYQFGANGFISSAAKSAGITLRVYIYNNDWSWSKSVEITSTTSSTALSTFNDVPSSGVYSIMAYAYPDISGNTATVTVNSYILQRLDGLLTTYVYPSCIDTSAKCYIDGVETSVGGDGMVIWGLNSEWQKYTFTFKTKSTISGEQSVLFRLHPSSVLGTTAYADICMPKLEIGMLATAYIPSDESLRGDRGPALRGPQDWEKCAVGFSFQAGGENDTYKDVVVYKGNYYSCIKSHAKSSSNYPTSAEDTQNGYWRLGDKLELIATQILLTTYALVKNLGVEVVEMKNSSGQVVFQAKNGNVTCNTGTFKNVNVSGVINADMMYSKTVTINTTNATAYTIDPDREPGTTFIIKNPTRNFWIQLPDAKKYDGLEIQVFTLTSNFTYQTYIRSKSGDALNIKPNIYNIPKDNGVSGFVAVENYNATYYRSAAGNDPWMMQPNMVYKFKSMAGEWYALEGLFTGE